MISWTLARALLRAVYKDRAALVAENLALRQQLIVLHRRLPRPPMDDRDRAFWVNLVSLWSGWRSALLMVRPATVVRWHRMGFRWYWRFKCRPGGGRPKIPVPVRQLIRRMSHVEYYNTSRTHQSLDGDAPDGRAVESPPGDVVETPMVGGLHHRYSRRAA